MVSVLSPLSPPPRADSCTHASQKTPSPTTTPHCSRGLGDALTDGPSRYWPLARCATAHDAPLPTRQSVDSETGDAHTPAANVGAGPLAVAHHPTAATPPVVRETCSSSSGVSLG